MARRLRTARERLARAEEELDEAVMAARERGATWEQVGEALGTTRQGAHRKYAARESERLASLDMALVIRPRKPAKAPATDRVAVA